MENSLDLKDKKTNQTVEEWLLQLCEETHLSKGATSVIDTILDNPEMASYASAGEIGTTAHVNIATVTRTAQALNFSGWPEWRQEIRARFLGQMEPHKSIDTYDVANHHNISDHIIGRTLGKIGKLKRSVNLEAIRSIAYHLAHARRRIIHGSGSYAGIAKILAHRAGLAGYRCELITDALAMANCLNDINEQDVIITINIWQLYKSAVGFADKSQRRGAKICVITDTITSAIAGLSDYLVIVPSENTAFLPSMVPTLSIVECICAELVAVDREYSTGALAIVEKQWHAFDLLHNQLDDG